MLQTNPVRQPPVGKAGADEIMEFPGTVKSRGIEIDVIMQVALVGVCADEELIFAFRPAHRRFKADFVGLFRRDLAGRERLSYLEEQRPALNGPGGGRLVLAFHQQELDGGCVRVAQVGGNRSHLLGIEPVGKPLLHCLGGAHSRRLLVGPDVGRGRGSTSLFQNRGGCIIQPPHGTSGQIVPKLNNCHSILVSSNGKSSGYIPECLLSIASILAPFSCIVC